MAFGTETIIVLTAISLSVTSSFLAFLTFRVIDVSVSKALMVMAAFVYLGGFLLTVSWFSRWGIRSGKLEEKCEKYRRKLSTLNKKEGALEKSIEDLEGRLETIKLSEIRVKQRAIAQPALKKDELERKLNE